MAAEAEVVEVGNESYQQEHMGAIFQEGFSFSGYERDYLALALGDGSYLNVSGISGVDSLSDGRGAVFADFDNDGDLDIFLVALQENAHHLFRNNVGDRSGFLRVTLQGRASGRDAWGAVVRVKTSAGTLTKVKSGGSGFLAQHDPRLLFGLGNDAAAEWVEVTWPSGLVQRLEGVDAGASIAIVEGGAGYASVAEDRFRLVDPLSAEGALLASLNLRLGEPLPDLALHGGDGRAGSISDLLRPGRRTLLNFWATYCIPCRREMPELQALHDRLRDAGIDLVGISIDTDSRDKVTPFLAGLGIDYPNYLTADPRVPDLYAGGRVSIPLSVLLDDQGRVLKVIGGWSEENAAAFRALAGGR